MRHESELSVHDIDGLTVAELIRNLQDWYQPQDRINIVEQPEYRYGGDCEYKTAIMIVPENKKTGI